MDVVHERCCGLDIHKNTAVACVITPGEGGRLRREVRSFGAMTEDVLELVDWLESCGVTEVAMESTGVYWKPFFNLLEASELSPILVNARDIKQVPGRKTDVKDAEWIAQLLRHGLLRPSFVPSRELRELRELTRYRRRMIQQRASEAQRLQKVLEGANIKLSSVASDVLGVSGRDMLQALIDGTQEPQILAEMARGRLKKKHVELERALLGSVGTHQRYMLRKLLAHIGFLEQQIEELNAEVEERMLPYERELVLLDEIWGIGRRTAQDLLAEIGTDMSHWPSSKHLASWAKICPGNNESAGKKRSGATGKGNPWLRAVLIEAAQNVKRNRDSQYSAQYRRIAGRRKDKKDRKKALVAVAHLLTAIYHMLRDGVQHHDLGANYLDEGQQHRSKSVAHHLRKLERLGYRVTLEEVVA